MTDPEPVNVGNPPAPRNGRPTKLTPFLIKQAETLLDKAYPQEVVAELIGVGKTTWYRWLQEAEKPGADRKLRDFRDVVARACARAEAMLVDRLIAAAEPRKAVSNKGNEYVYPGDWRAALAVLERQRATRWAAKRTIHVDPDEGAAKEVTLEDLRRMKEEQDAAHKGRNGRNGA